MRSMHGVLFAICILCVIGAVLVASQQVTNKRIAVWMRKPADLTVDVLRELRIFNGAVMAGEISWEAPPPTLAELLDRIDQRQRAQFRLLNSGSDWWETPFHYEVLPLGNKGSNLVIRTYGANRKDDGGTGDDVQIEMVFLKR